jgi:prevent-host-death family protein
MSEIYIGIRELKTRLSAYLRKVKEGDIIVITEHGEPVGRIVPASEQIQDRLERLVKTGQVAWSGNPLPEILPIAATRGEITISDMILEDRD